MNIVCGFLKRTMVLIFILGSFSMMLAAPLVGAVEIDDPQKFRRYNPDGKKYEFTKNYITALSYLKSNEERSQRLQDFSVYGEEEVKRTRDLLDGFKSDNVNLRAARNILDKFDAEDNGLMLQAVDMFKTFCNRQVELNKQEEVLLNGLYDAQSADAMENFDRESFVQTQGRISSARKESYKQLLATTLLVEKIMVSTQTDGYGYFNRLDVTTHERDKLLSKMDVFVGGAFQGDVREGQSFLEASVAVLRSSLTNPHWSLKEN